VAAGIRFHAGGMEFVLLVIIFCAVWHKVLAINENCVVLSLVINLFLLILHV